jgi:carboxypeptidase C (cathepsin A)
MVSALISVPSIKIEADGPGGPGCSSTTGLLFELGGCTIVDEGQNVTYNKHSWNNNANILFLDQPVGVGYSYSDSGDVNNSPAAAEDVYAFLILFISQVSGDIPHSIRYFATDHPVRQVL